MGGMIRSLLLLLWAGVSVSTMLDLQKRIINGQNCKTYERLYHVKVSARSTTRISRCGGSLISDRWILTARHCWKPDRTIEAQLGVHPRGNEITETISEENIRKHDSADIMLLKLTTPRPGFHHIDLPDCVNHPTPRKGTEVQIAGYGAITAAPDGTRNPTVVDHLKCAKIKVQDCPWASDPDQYEKVFCGKTDDIKKPVDACKGDSGGGVVYKKRIYGVIVTGGKKACTEEVEFMDVCGYMDWITRITGIKPPKTFWEKVNDVSNRG